MLENTQTPVATRSSVQVAAISYMVNAIPHRVVFQTG